METIATNLSLWQSYEYIGPNDKFHPAQIHTEKGPNGEAAISTDDSMWSIDTPENPHSILALLYYPAWNLEPLYDLRDASIEFSLRGDNLKLHGGHCYFWIHTATLGSTRWHYIKHPLPVKNGKWTRNNLTLSTNPKDWHNSFVSDPNDAKSLPLSLKACASFGFSFTGFSKKATGQLSLSSFKIKTNICKNWPYNSKFTGELYWKTVSRKKKKQKIINCETATDRDVKVIFNHNDFLLLNNHAATFSYLAFINSQKSTKGADLRNSYVFFRQIIEMFDPKGGSIHFFVENSKTGTIWVERGKIKLISSAFSMILSPDEKNWLRLSGTDTLESLLMGTAGQTGYDYFGFMVVGAQKNPSGLWGLSQFTIGPRIIEE